MCLFTGSCRFLESIGMKTVISLFFCLAWTISPLTKEDNCWIILLTRCGKESWRFGDAPSWRVQGRNMTWACDICWGFQQSKKALWYNDWHWQDFLRSNAWVWRNFDVFDDARKEYIKATTLPSKIMIMQKITHLPFSRTTSSHPFALHSFAHPLRRSKSATM
jgi:hypothetical protein